MCQVCCSCIADIYAQLRGVNLLWVYIHCAIYETYFMLWFCRDLCYICHEMCQVWCSSIEGIYAQLGGVKLPWVYVHCGIYETYLM